MTILCDTADMEITDAQYRHIAPWLPRQRGNVTLDNLHVPNAILYVAEQGCKWRGLPKRFGNWHTIYTRMNRWSKSGCWIASLPSYSTHRSSARESKPSPWTVPSSRSIQMARGR